MPLKRQLKYLLFDLDDTLYRAPGVGRQVLHGIHGYMVRHLGFTQEEAVAKATELYYAHGTTLAGLVANGHKVDYDRWHAEVHYEHVEYSEHVHADPALRELLLSMPLPKYVFTNADKRHAEICLERLGIADCFQGVFHFEFLHNAAIAAGLTQPSALHPHGAVVCKPSAASYDLVLQAVGARHEEVLFFDDSARNIKGAHDVGIATVMVGTETLVPGADLCLPDLHHVPRLMPELLQPSTAASAAAAATATAAAATATAAVATAAVANAAAVLQPELLEAELLLASEAPTAERLISVSSS